jgi:hypothetical protein
VSAVEGVQAHTLNIWESIRDLDLPVLIFISKMDRAGACGDQVFSESAAGDILFFGLLSFVPVSIMIFCL